MTPNELNKILCAILTTALETEPAAFPESYAYLAAGIDLERWQMIQRIMIAADLATFAGYNIKLTDKGRALAQQVNEFTAKASQ